MQINSVPSASIAASVWANATRTLTANPVTRTSVTARISIPATTVQDLRPAAGFLRRLSIVHVNNPGATDLIGLYDGTTFDGQGATTTGANPLGYGNSTRGLSIDNTAAGASSFTYAGWDESV